MTLLEQARKYVFEDGFSVFPLVHRGKSPFENWKWGYMQNHKPTDEFLTAWFSAQQYPFNIAIVTGAISGKLLVLDFDDMSFFPIWQDRTGIETRLVKTRRGVHVYLRCEDAFNGLFFIDGVHVGEAKHDGGFVIAPPSIHPKTGKPYIWMNEVPIQSVRLSDLHIDPVESKKKTVLAKPVQMSPQKAGIRHKARSQDGVKNPVKYAQSVLLRECEKVAGIQEGQRNSLLYCTSCHVLRKFQDVLTWDEMTTALIQAGIDAGLSEREALRTVQSAMKHV